jgi:uncharacterized protein YjbI with pentapeptide repeats
MGCEGADRIHQVRSTVGGSRIAGMSGGKLDRGGRRGLSAALLAVSVVSVFMLGDAGVSGASARPDSGAATTVSSFTVSPSALPSTGGTATLSADVTNASDCTFSSKKPVAGLPVSVPCSNGPVSTGITVAAITGNKAVTYKFALAVTGTKTVKAKTSLTVAPPYCSNIAPGADLKNCDLSGADLSDADLSGADLFESNLTTATLLDTNLSDTNMTLATLAGADADGATFVNATLSDAKLPDAELAGADMVGARMTDSHLTDAVLTGADLQDVDFDGASLQGANFTQADLDDAYMTPVNVTGAVWDDTTCPDGSNSNNDGDTCANNLG